MVIDRISRPRYAATMGLAVAAAGCIVAVAAFIGRGALNLKAALTDKPDVGIWVLLENDGITSAELLREQEKERDYLVTTASGSEFVKLKKGEVEWYIAEREQMHE